jgi:hypothetical protein
LKSQIFVGSLCRSNRFGFLSFQEKISSPCLTFHNSLRFCDLICGQQEHPIIQLVLKPLFGPSFNTGSKNRGRNLIVGQMASQTTSFQHFCLLLMRGNCEKARLTRLQCGWKICMNGFCFRRDLRDLQISHMV